MLAYDFCIVWSNISMSFGLAKDNFGTCIIIEAIYIYIYAVLKVFNTFYYKL